MSRLSRKAIKHDKFVEDVGTAYSFAQKNRRNLILAAAAVIVVIAGVYGVVAWRHHKEAIAQQRLGDAIAIMNTPVAGTPAAENAASTIPSEQERFTRAQPVLAEVTAKYPGTDAADVAELYLARIAVARGDIESARPKFEKFVREHPENILAGSAQASLYQMRLRGDEVKSLIPEIESKLAEQEPLVPKDVLLSILAQAYEVTGDETKARDAYRRITTEYPDSAYVIDAQRKLATSAG